jgi:hypothetical protein
MCVHVNLTSNPLLAETFEIPELKFIAEKVSHNPVVIAHHAEGECWEMYATSCGKTKFWGTWGIMNCQRVDQLITCPLPRQKLRIYSCRDTSRQDWK